MAETKKREKPDYTDEEKRLQDEIREYQEERDRIKMIIGKIGGRRYSKIDMIINVVFLAIIFTLFILELTLHIIPAFLSLEIGIFLVSIKLIIMIHSQQKTNHFQFWVLNSIEFRLNEMHKKVRELDKHIYDTKEKDQ